MEAQFLNATTLAYIGDAYYELLVREYLIGLGFQKPDVLQKKSVQWVSAKAQAYFLKQLEADGFFTENESEVIKRGRNTNTVSRAKNASMNEYRYATGFEALIGYLYFENEKSRINEIMEEMQKIGAYE